jgi:DNA-binding NarL/FixJ family response regulator
MSLLNREPLTIPSQIRVLSVDDRAFIREGIAALIANQTDICLVAEASNGHEAIEQFRSHRPDVTLMDLQMPEMNGIDALIAIRSEFPLARIIVLTTYAGEALCLRAMKAGAYAYILKGGAHKDLLDTIRAVRAGKKLIHAEAAAELASHAADHALSGIEVLSLIAAGNSNKLLGGQLSISGETVRLGSGRSRQVWKDTCGAAFLGLAFLFIVSLLLKAMIR